MRIAFVVTSLAAPTHTFLVNMVTALIDRGHELEIYDTAEGPPPFRHPAVEKYNLLRCTKYVAFLPQHGLGRLGAFAKLAAQGLPRAPRAFLRSLRAPNYSENPVSRGILSLAAPGMGSKPYDIVHAHFGPNGLRALSLLKAGVLRGSLVTTFWGPDLVCGSRNRPLDYYHPLFEHGQLCITMSNFCRKQIMDLGCPPEKAIVLTSGVVSSRFTFQERHLQPGEPVKVLSVARLHEVKGLEYALAAFAKVVERYPQTQYNIVGEGPLRPKIEALIVELGLQGKAQLLGWKTEAELIEIYRQSHLLVLTSVTTSDGAQEAHGISLLEAQAMGLPILATHSGGIPDSVVDGKSGFLVPERDVPATADRLMYLVEHPEQWPEMGRAGREHVAANFEADMLYDRQVETYKQIINRV